MEWVLVTPDCNTWSRVGVDLGYGGVGFRLRLLNFLPLLESPNDSRAL